MIRTVTLEPGEVYTDRNGQRREVVKALKHMVKFRPVRQGRYRYPAMPLEVGQTRWIGRNQFCEWADGVAA